MLYKVVLDKIVSCETLLLIQLNGTCMCIASSQIYLPSTLLMYCVCLNLSGNHHVINIESKNCNISFFFLYKQDTKKILQRNKIIYLKIIYKVLF